MTLPDYVANAIKSGPVPKIRNFRSLDYSDMTTGERVCSFIEKHVVVPEGVLVGKKVKLETFQVAFILSVYDNPDVTKLAILSMARKNAKTATIAFLMLAHICGPVAVLNSRLNSGAMSREQASEVFNYASKSARLSPSLNQLVRVIPSLKTISGLALNTEYKALSADASTNIGGSGIVICMDEVGQIRGPRSDFLDALTTSQAAHENPLMFYISTQAPTDADLLSIAIDDAVGNKPPDTVCHLYEAEKDCDVMDEDQWRNSNPALGVFRSERDLSSQAKKAGRMPSFRNTFRNLLLNQRVASFATFIDPQEWRKNNGVPKPLIDCLRIYGGLDLSSHKDLTSFVLLGECEEGLSHVYPYFWMPSAGLLDREKEDKAPYSLWRDQGFLNVVDGATIDYDYVVLEIADILNKAGVFPDVVAFDRWRIDVFKRSLDKIDFDLPMVEMGTGFKDQAPALDVLESRVLAASMRHGDNPVLNMCAINAVAVEDSSKNRKLEKRRATGRIDGMAALAMAVGAKNKLEVEDDSLEDFLEDPIVV